MPKYLQPVDPRFSQPGHPPATIDEFEGVRFLHLGSSWVQGAMRLSKPDAIELEYVQMMMMWTLFLQAPRHIVQLGLGSAALTKFCYQRFPDARVTAVELNPNVIAICRALFGLPEDDARLKVREMNALDFVLDRANHGTADVLQVDLYDQDARGPVLDTPEFYQGCHDCLKEGGIMTANVFGDVSNYDKNLLAMQDVFDAVVWLPEVHDANIVVLAFKNAPQLDFSVLYERAAEIKRRWNLPAKNWVNGLKEWMRDHQG
ncbi:MULTISPECIES: spermidine synthase [unclassified Massilia]|uniref:spermine/spermidine synthase domain-containing protein n=1 Tax=unclassified Massilia TaxID=2609279 RepID=UPI001B832D59|nr:MULTISPECIES: spermidine synthase [unclassified Massilia]MBQ5940659.1 spermidine synthase [Massilia sp. AB1]MBQ5961715.1 spermidine synthase [Massilia sp. ZL223]